MRRWAKTGHEVSGYPAWFQQERERGGAGGCGQSNPAFESAESWVGRAGEPDVAKNKLLSTGEMGTKGEINFSY